MVVGKNGCETKPSTHRDLEMFLFSPLVGCTRTGGISSDAAETRVSVSITTMVDPRRMYVLAAQCSTPAYLTRVLVASVDVVRTDPDVR